MTQIMLQHEKKPKNKDQNETKNQNDVKNM